jgi:hypothetical protein
VDGAFRLSSRDNALLFHADAPRNRLTQSVMENHLTQKLTFSTLMLRVSNSVYIIRQNSKKVKAAAKLQAAGCSAVPPTSIVTRIRDFVSLTLQFK